MVNGQCPMTPGATTGRETLAGCKLRLQPSETSKGALAAQCPIPAPIRPHIPPYPTRTPDSEREA